MKNKKNKRKKFEQEIKGNTIDQGDKNLGLLYL